MQSLCEVESPTFRGYNNNNKNEQQQQNRDEPLQRDLQGMASKEEGLAGGTHRKVKMFAWAVVGNAKGLNLGPLSNR